MQEKNSIFLIFYCFLNFIWQKLIFLCNRIVETGLRGCLLNTPLSQKNPLAKKLQARQG
jgi:hypothetical protein